MIKIALYQFEIVWEDKKANLEKLVEICEKASEEGVELLLLPEMSFTGFSMNTSNTVAEEKEIVETVQFLARKFGMYISFGWVGNVNRSDINDFSTKCHNHYSVVGPEGMISDYRKIHPFSYSDEDQYFEGGDKISIYSLKMISFSTFICYDLRFPEIFQIASKKSHIIIIPACWPKRRSEHWKSLLQARAIENQSYIVGINCVGNIGGIEYSGDSRIVNPNGEIVAQTKSGQEELLIYNLVDDVEEYRDSFPVKNDRKEAFYEGLRHEFNGKF